MKHTELARIGPDCYERYRAKCPTLKPCQCCGNHVNESMDVTGGQSTVEKSSKYIYCSAGHCNYRSVSYIDSAKAYADYNAGLLPRHEVVA